MSKMIVNYLGDEKTEITHLPTKNKIITDLPPDNGGRGRNFSPTDLFAASLGSCILTIMGKMAARDNLDLSNCSIEMEKEMSTNTPRRIAKLTGIINFPKQITKEQKEKLMAAVVACPVHKSLHPDIQVSFVYKDKLV